MKKFNEGLDSIIEGYGFHKTVTRERYPAKLKLSEEFINAFKEEFAKQTSPIYTEKDDGSQVLAQDASAANTVLRLFQNALKFIINFLELICRLSS